MATIGVSEDSSAETLRTTEGRNLTRGSGEESQTNGIPLTHDHGERDEELNLDFKSSFENEAKASFFPISEMNLNVYSKSNCV